MTNRPLSPHLQIYRPQLTSVLSITHRATGVALSLGTMVLLYWLQAVARGPEAYAAAQEFRGCWLVKLVLAGWTWAFFYHLCNGIRHLFWDAGYGFEKAQARRSAAFVVAFAVVAGGVFLYLFFCPDGVRS